MIRRLVVTAAAVSLVSVVGFGRGAWSYIKTSYNDVTDSVESAVPVDFQIRRARTMLADLTPEVRENMLTIAREEAAIAQLAEQIAEHEGRQEQDKSEILKLSSDLESGRPTFRYAGREYTAEQVRTDLARRFARHKTSDETLHQLQSQLDARRQGLLAAHDKMNALLAAKRQLEVEVEQLDARRMMIDAAQTTSRLALDDGALSRTKQLVADLKARLDVSERLVAAETAPLDEIPVGQSEDDVLEQVAEYFGTSTPDVDSKLAHAKP